MSKKILLADDSITIQKVISITFASEDYELIVVGDGDAAIRKAKEAKPDLVMADVAMPGKSGYEVCAMVKGDPDTKNTPVMLLAGTFEPLNAGEAARVKADDSIVKPFESQELLDKVKALLSRQAAAEPVKAAPEKRTAAKPERPEDIWEATDFLSFTDELSEKPDFKETETPDLSFLEEGYESAPQDLSNPHEDFTDLEFREEDLKPKEERKEPAPPAVEKEKASFEPLSSDTFEDVVPFDFKEEELKTEPVVQEAPPKEAAAKPFWAETVREPEAVKEAPPMAETEQELLEAAPEITAEAVEAVEPVEEARSPFKGYAEPAAAEITEPRMAESVERAASKAEDRMGADLEARAEGQVARAVEAVAGRMERSFRGDLDARLRSAEAEITRVIEGTAAKVEGRLRDDIGARLEKSISVPKEEVAEIVRRVAKEVIEEVAWEVIPDLAEELIKAEINRVKEALVRPK